MIGPKLERYNDYGARIRDILGQFGRTVDENTQRELMEEMEGEAFEELRGFLRVTKKARFIL